MSNQTATSTGHLPTLCAHRWNIIWITVAIFSLCHSGCTFYSYVILDNWFWRWDTVIINLSNRICFCFWRCSKTASKIRFLYVKISVINKCNYPLPLWGYSARAFFSELECLQLRLDSAESDLGQTYWKFSASLRNQDISSGFVLLSESGGKVGVVISLNLGQKRRCLS